MYYNIIDLSKLHKMLIRNQRPNHNTTQNQIVQKKKTVFDIKQKRAYFVDVKRKNNR